jgi:hypothetical protein
MRPRPSANRHRLRLETLEQRDMPSATVWGVPWPDGQHLTLSLAPDGTTISGEQSSLSQVLANAGTSGELALLQAFQTWADYTNVNFGLVSDGGEAFGVGRAIQDDPRFGDIRVGAVPLASDVIAVTSPFNFFNTYSGDVVLNSSQAIGSTYNLYNVALHEAGHALGLPDNNDLSSVMYEYYNGTNGALDANDIAAIQSLYGARTTTATNTSFATAATYTNPVSGSLNSPGETDDFKFSTPLLIPGTTIHLQAEGLSLLEGTVSVYNSRGQLVASTTATSPTSNDLTLKLNNLSGWSTYYVTVSSPSGGVFDVGSYNLTVTNNLTTAVGDVTGGLFGLLGGVGQTLTTATGLVANTLDLNGQVNYNARSNLSSVTETDFYSVLAPNSSGAATETMVASAWTTSNQSLAPRISVFDSFGNPVAFQALTETSGQTTIQVTNAVPGQRYEIEVKSAAAQTGSYALSVSYLSTAILFPLGTSGTLNASTPTDTSGLEVPQSQFMHFVLSAGATTDPNVVLTMTITDANGNVVGTLTASQNDSASVDLFLAAGDYTISITESSTDGCALPPINFALNGIGLTDPVAVSRPNPNSTSTAASASSSSSNATMSPATPSGSTVSN